jgi:plasmid stability protein
MPILNIRNLPPQVHRALRVRAARAGRSMEAEAREILAAACQDDERLTAAEMQAWVDRQFQGARPQSVVEELLAQRRAEAAREAGDQA